MSPIHRVNIHVGETTTMVHNGCVHVTGSE